MGLYVFLAIFAAVVVFVGVSNYRANARKGLAIAEGRQRKQRDEAMFVSVYPELQPYYHPESLLSFVTARRKRTPPAGSSAWDDPPGFFGMRAEVSNEIGNEVYRILDKAGALLTTFRFETHAEGGVLRVGKGKLTVRSVDEQNPRVSYWHPDREFKWTRRKGWAFATAMAAAPFTSEGSVFDDRPGYSGSSSSGSDRPDAFEGGGGTFDGGGASGGWEGGSSSGDFASVESGSSSSAGSDSSSASTSTSY